MPEYNSSCGCNNANKRSVQNNWNKGSVNGNNRPSYNNNMMARNNMPAWNSDKRKMNKDREMDCPCDRDDPLMDMPLGMAYVPWQIWEDLYEPVKGLNAGTIFAKLDKPFTECSLGGGSR